MGAHMAQLDTSGVLGFHRKADLAAYMVAEGEASYSAISATCGLTRNTLARWRHRPDFQARVEAIRAEFRDHVRRRGIAVRERRVAAYNRRWQAMHALIEARAADPEMEGVPGGDTGLVVKEVKGIGSGDTFRQVDTYTFDAGLLKELRELERQAAEDLGQWTEKREVTHGGEVALSVAIEAQIAKVYGLAAIEDGTTIDVTPLDDTDPSGPADQ